MSRSLCVGIAAAVGLCLFFISGAPAQESPKAAKVWSYGELKWQDDKTLPSVQSVPLWGDPATGEHGMLRKFRAGYAPPPHKHPSVERVVVISGTIIVRYAGSGDKTLGPGSYSEIPPYTTHAVKCGEQSDCVFLLASSGPFAIVQSSDSHNQ
jgi:quercetin dioxygenase-like cupin family protein